VSKTDKPLPQTLLQAVRYFADPDICVEFVAKLRWPDGPVCPNCDGTEHYFLTTRRLWKCKNKACRKQFSVKVGTIFEDSAIPLDKWLTAIWLIANAKNGISSHELGRSIGLTQKSAWFVLHRIRLAMQTGTFQKFDGEVEVDETFVGGKAKNMHKGAREKKIRGTGGMDKTIVVGARSRGGNVRAAVVPDRNAASLVPFVRDHVTPGATIYTDAHQPYKQLRDDYKHEITDHVAGYAVGKITTNRIENFWALLKRGLAGSYVAVDPQHLFRYVDERVFTFNLRNFSDLERFQTVLGRAAGRRLTYAELTA
jgi:transposase-like protein